MRKFSKNFKTKKMTVEGMLTCAQKCMKGCVHCSTACGGSAVNGQALLGAPIINGTTDYELVAYGSAIG